MFFVLCLKSRSFTCIIIVVVLVVQAVAAAAQEQPEDILIALLVRQKRTAAQVTPGKELTKTQKRPYHDNHEARHRPPRENLEVGYSLLLRSTSYENDIK